MDVVWGAGGREGDGEKPWPTRCRTYAYTTVATVLNRLSRKGTVVRRMDSNVARFAPTGTQADHLPRWPCSRLSEQK